MKPSIMKDILLTIIDKTCVFKHYPQLVIFITAFKRKYKYEQNLEIT